MANLTYADGIQKALSIVTTFPYHSEGWAEVQDTCDELALNLRKHLEEQGSVAQSVTQRPAKTSAPQGAVGSTPTATAISLKNKRVAFTGTLSRMTRADATKRNTRAGVITQSGVSNTTDFLVVAHASGSVKWNDAVKRGVPVLSEDEWYTLTI